MYYFLLISEALVCLGYNRQEIEYSLAEAKYDDVFATYLLLGRKSTDVSTKVDVFLCNSYKPCKKFKSV